MFSRFFAASGSLSPIGVCFVVSCASAGMSSSNIISSSLGPVGVSPLALELADMTDISVVARQTLQNSFVHNVHSSWLNFQLAQLAPWT